LLGLQPLLDLGEGCHGLVVRQTGRQGNGLLDLALVAFGQRGGQDTPALGEHLDFRGAPAGKFEGQLVLGLRVGRQAEAHIFGGQFDRVERVVGLAGL
jgi:hypothetical protein